MSVTALGSLHGKGRDVEDSSSDMSRPELNNG